MTLLAGMLGLNAALRAAIIRGAGIGQNLARGEFRESDLRDALRPHIPRRFELSSGEVVNSTGAVSRQQDVIVSDAYAASPFVSSGGIGTHPIEAVYATLQVKSRADTTSVVDAVTNLASVKALCPEEKWGYTVFQGSSMSSGVTNNRPFTALIGLELHGKPESVFHAYAEANLALPPLDRTDVFLALDRFVVLWHQDEQISPTDRATSVRCHMHGELSTLIFYVALMEWLRRHVPPPLDLFGYAVPALGADESHEMIIRNL